MKRLSLALIFVLCVQAQKAPYVPVTDAMLQNPDPADWLMWRRTLNSWGYSPLNQINRANVGQLKMIWMRGMGPGVQEATPLVYHGYLSAESKRSGAGHQRYNRRPGLGIPA